MMVGGGPKTPANFVQDGPPAGGFPAINTRRSLPGGGMSSIAMAGASVLTLTFGMYTVMSANAQRREFAREETDMKMAVLPFLAAESDCKLAFIKGKQLANEAELMKDVPDWEVGASAYKTTYLPPMKVFGMHK